MDTVLIILGSLFVIVGFIGAWLPVLPGMPVSYVGLLALQLTSEPPFSFGFMVVWAVITVILMILDNIIPAYGTRKFGGSPYGVWGTILGLFIGFFFPPVGIIAGPLAGAFAGELLAGKRSDQALRAALGSFAGFLAGTLLKVIACGVMGYYFFSSL